MMDSLHGVVVITGASSGIGQGTALAFAEAGCKRILLGDINDGALTVTRDQVLKISPSTEVETAHVDITSEASVQAFIDLCVARFGRVDYACNVAGIVPPRRPIIDIDPDEFDRVIAVNTYGTFLCHRAEIRQMLLQEPLPNSSSRGSIISVSSMAGLNASPGVSPYASTKHAIVGLVKTDAADYGQHGIRVNAICPGFTETQALRDMSTAEQRTAIAESVPLTRLGQAVEIGRMMAFLCSERASYLHGATYIVDGGALTYRQA